MKLIDKSTKKIVVHGVVDSWDNEEWMLNNGFKVISEKKVNDSYRCVRISDNKNFIPSENIYRFLINEQILPFDIKLKEVLFGHVIVVSDDKFFDLLDVIQSIDKKELLKL